LVINLAFTDKVITGLGVFSNNISRGLSKLLEISWIAPEEVTGLSPLYLKSPESVVIGARRLSAIYRFIWMRKQRFSSDVLLYSPTHHVFPNAEKQIITVHDLICFRFPLQHIFQFFYFRYYLPRHLNKVVAIITVSETSRQEIASAFSYPVNKIHVISNGLPFDDVAEVDSSVTDEDYLLVVGARYWHKNIHSLLLNARAWCEGYKIVIVSAGGLYFYLLHALKIMCGLRDKVLIKRYVSESELTRLYRSCAALIYPSMHEGFGIPPIECLYHRRPVIVSDIPIHREVLGTNARYIDLEDTSRWKVLISETARSGWSKKNEDGRSALLFRYSWSKSAEALAQVLRGYLM
jgi:glycosyltransferase involved in cell wall biosynthesis